VTESFAACEYGEETSVERLQGILFLSAHSKKLTLQVTTQEIFSRI